ncbi:ubiquitin-conjugating enzyme E2-binding protein [Xylariales sp. PMI_506]|nr:ubiquitin-conjugating enzyme E2-binding protein [Xylariales sp. PMI_506]
MSVGTEILIYAELLSNIRQVSVACSLTSPIASTTKANVSPDGLTLSVFHGDVERLVQLPAKVSAPAQLPIQNRDSLVLSWRLPLAPSQPTTMLSSMDAQVVPWSAQDLQPDAVVKCRACKTPVVSAGLVKTWKDLPSENWAEMMEFWHCHKPHNHGEDPSGHDTLATTRGYGANTRIAAQAGTGFVDLASFLFHNQDCTNLTFSEPVDVINASRLADDNKAPATSVCCGGCSVGLGYFNREASSVTLYKWQLELDTTPGSPSSPPPSLANCVSSMLLSVLARSGCSKSVIFPTPVSQPPYPAAEVSSLLHIWLFNSNITFSSTEAQSSPVPAVKVLYKFISQADADRIMESMTSDVQEIALPSVAAEEITSILDQSNVYLPTRDRRFQDWSVGLLEKWVIGR